MASSDSEDNAKDVDVVSRKRGRPPKEPKEGGGKEATEAPKEKRSPGRPKGSKNKTHKEKPVDTSPKRPRGRPRKWPPVEKPTGPKRKRGRPRKNPPPETEDVEESAEQDDEQT